MDKLRSILAGLGAAVGAAPNCTAAAVVALLGLGGSATATMVVGWLMPVLIALSVLLLGRSFYILYVKGRGTRVTTVITWLSAFLVVGFWSWRIAENVIADEQACSPGTTISCSQTPGESTPCSQSQCCPNSSHD